MANFYDTIVVGLGAAGTTAATTLARADRRVLALEGQARLGGRVKTVPFGDGVVEEGAEWMHGTDMSRAYELAIENDIFVVEQDVDIEVYWSNGEVGQSELVQELMEYCLGAIAKQPEKSEPMGQYVTRMLIAHLKDKHPLVLKDKDFINEFLVIMNLVVNNNEASSDWNDVNAYTQYRELDGHQHVSWHRHGYKTFLEIMLNTYKNGTGLPTLDVKYNKEVTLIKWPKNTTEPVEVTCKDGDQYTASNVIVTVSLGVLKERQGYMFSPSLPQEKMTVIDKIGMGVMDKIILKFDSIWWPIEKQYFFFLWKEEDRIKISKEDVWITKIFSCSISKGSSNVLVMWTSGDYGKMVEVLPEEVVKKKAMELLRRFLGKSFTIPEPTALMRSMWYSNPFTRGSYSYDSIAMAPYPNARSILGEPLVDIVGTPVVLFAGEATDPVHFSTVHGASDSGYREAMRVLSSSRV